MDTSGVRTSATRQTARFTATNDEAGNQIASFYPGAMSEDGEIDITSLAAANGIELVLIGAGDPVAMQQHTADCRAAGIPFASDFSQQVAFLDGESMRTLIEGAVYLFCNEYEASAIESKTGWSSEDILARVGTRIVTLGAEGARVERQGEAPVVVGPVTDATFVEPTGAATRSAAASAATAWGLPLSAPSSSATWWRCTPSRPSAPRRRPHAGPAGRPARLAYGDEAAAELTAHLPA